MCVSVCLSLCVSLANDFSETVNVIIIKRGTVTVSDLRIHHVFIILTLTFIQGNVDLNHEQKTCSIISEIVPAMPIKFAAKVVRLKVYIHFASPMTFTFTQGHSFLSNATSSHPPQALERRNLFFSPLISIFFQFFLL